MKDASNVGNAGDKRAAPTIDDSSELPAWRISRWGLASFLLLLTVYPACFMSLVAMWANNWNRLVSLIVMVASFAVPTVASLIVGCYSLKMDGFTLRNLLGIIGTIGSILLIAFALFLLITEGHFASIRSL